MAAVFNSLSASKKEKVKAKKNTEDVESKYRQRVLLLSSRGVTYRHQQLLNDLHALLPHSRRESKLDTKTQLHQLNELAALYNCNNVLFFEARKARDLYCWLAKPPNGPTLKFHLQHPHPMAELHFPGNCLKGSRPILSFDAGFERAPHWRLAKEVLTHVFAVPKGARKVKPFVDHVMGFSIADGRVWVRCYEIRETAAQAGAAAPTGMIAEAESVPAAAAEEEEDGVGAAKRGKGERDISLVEIGPRFSLTPIVILEGSFGGPVIYENPDFVSPNKARTALRTQKAGRHAAREERKEDARARRRDLGLNTGEGEREVDEMDDRVLFA